MKKHWKKLALGGGILVVILIVLLVLVIKHLTATPETRRFDDLTFQVSGEFQYGKLVLGSSSDAVSKQAGTSLVVDQSRAPFPMNGAFYKLDQAYILVGQTADVLLDFYDDRLTVVRLSFRLEGTYADWFSQLTEHLQQCYGPAQETLTALSPETGIASTGYKWDAENTSLQVVLQQGDSIIPSATISIGLLQ